MRSSHSSRWVATGLVVACLALGPAQQAAAEETPSLEPQIITSGTAEETIPATTASFSIDIASLAASAASASTASARAAGAVRNALQVAGLSRNEIAQSQLTVAPRWEYDAATRKQKRTGYEATTVIRIETDRLDRLGAYMDAALGAGATGVSAISFAARNSDEARRRALARAVAEARADAETIARAGGGALGRLLLLTTMPQSTPRGVEPLVLSARAAGAEGTSITPAQIRITATVVGHWRLLPDEANAANVGQAPGTESGSAAMIPRLFVVAERCGACARRTRAVRLGEEVR